MQRLLNVDKQWRSPLTLTSESRVVAVGFVPGGKQLVSASEGGNIRMWDISTGRVISERTLSISIRTAKFSTDCKLLVSKATADGSFSLWDVLSGQKIYVLPEKLPYRANRGLVFSPDGKRLAIYNIDDLIIIYDTEKGLILKEHQCRPLSWISAVVFSPDSGQLGILVKNGNSRKLPILLWDMASEKNPKELWKRPFPMSQMDYDYRFIAMGFTADGKCLAAAKKVPPNYGPVRIWNVESGQLIKELTNPEFLVHAATFSSDSNQLAFRGGKRGATLWNLDSGGMERLSTPVPVRESIVYYGQDDMLFSPDHKQLTVHSQNTIMIWSIRARNEHETFVGHGDAVTAIEISPGGSKLASASKDTMIKLWDLYSGKETKRLSGHKGSITAMTFSPDGTHLATASADDTIRFWNAISGEEVDKLSRCGREVKTIAFSPNGEDLLWISPEGEVWLYKITWRRNRNYGVRGILLRNKKPEKLKGLTSPVTTIAFSGDGELRALGSEDGIVRVWNLASKESKFLEMHGATISAVAFLPDGKKLAVASSDNAVTLWNIMSGSQVQKITLFASISSLKVSSDGQAMETDRGTIEFLGLFSSPQQSGQKPPRNIFFAREWIYRGNQRLLWLPLEYRGRCWAVRGNLVVIGQESGAVTFLEFAMEKGNEVVD